jgi:hypothetical protein
MDDPHDDDAQSKIISRQPVLPPPAPPVPSTTSSVSGLDASTLREFLEIAKRDIEIRQQEIDLQRQEKANSHEYSKLALDAQVTDRQDDRKDKRSARLEKMGFALAGSILLAALLVTSMYMGHEQIALEGMKGLGLVLIAGYGGYQYAARKFSKSDSE